MSKSNNYQFFAPVGGKEDKQADQEPWKESTDYSIWLNVLGSSWNGLRIC